MKQRFNHKAADGHTWETTPFTFTYGGGYAGAPRVFSALLTVGDDEYGDRHDIELNKEDLLKLLEMVEEVENQDPVNKQIASNMKDTA